MPRMQSHRCVSVKESDRRLLDNVHIVLLNFTAALLDAKTVIVVIVTAAQTRIMIPNEFRGSYLAQSEAVATRGVGDYSVLTPWQAVGRTTFLPLFCPRTDMAGRKV